MHLPRVIALSALILCAFTGTIKAQSFNVDFNSSTGFGAGAPIPSYPAAAGQPGTWNSILTTSPLVFPLVNLNGTPSSATLTRQTETGNFNTTNQTTSGNFSLLHDDFQFRTGLGLGGQLVYAFSNLEAGDYAVFTYAANPESSASGSFVSVAGSSSTASQGVVGVINGNNYAPGLTHAVHIKQSVPAGGSITINIARGGDESIAVCGGIQLVKMTAPRLRVYVNDNPPISGIKAGGSWTDAYTDLNLALQTVRLAGGAFTEIWTAQGVYTPSSNNDRFDAFVIPANVNMYGGFAGPETSLAQRTNPAAFPTELSGELNGPSNIDNSLNVVRMDATSQGTILMDGFTISKGSANFSLSQPRGGAVVITGNCSPRFRNCRFTANSALNEGGAVYIDGTSDPEFVNCIFTDNSTSGTGAPGGAISMTANVTSFRIVNCQFFGNISNGDGGAIFNNGTPGEIINSIFSSNVAFSNTSKGGAVACMGIAGNITFRNSTIANNICFGGTGGVSASLGADVTFHNCILWDNADSNGPGTVTDNIDAVAAQGSTSATFFTTVQGLAGQNGQNPLFIDANGADNVLGTLDDNLRLSNTSPGIDAGDSNQVGTDFADLDANANTAEATPLDLDRNPRRRDIASVVDTGTNGAPMPDRGAYERVPAACFGDLNSDGQRNTADLVIFLGQFGTAGANLISDLNNDGVVNTLDLTQFLGVFGTPCP